jgi:DNA polymerase elongation subunit (family B)
MNSSGGKSKPKGKPAPSKRKQTSLLTQILSQIKDQPIRPSNYPNAPTSVPPGVLVNIDYQGDAGVAKLKIYDIAKAQIYEWLDNTQHHPYCLTDFSRDDLSQQNDVVGHSGFLKLDTTPKYNLLRDQEEEYTIIVARDPLAIGGRQNSIREKLGRDHAWEADIRYTQCYTMDRALTPGLIYRVQQTKLVPVPQEFSPEDAKKIRELFKDDKELSKLIEEYLPLFLTPAPSLPRLAIDIEVESEFIDRIPDPDQAPQPIISVAFVDDTGVGKILMLSRGSEDVTQEKLPDSVTVDFFDDEKVLIETVFRIIWRTPILLTFNGDNFDLQYLVNRGKKLGIPSSANPIRLRGGFRGNPEAELDYGVHIDLYRFFHNRSIQIYAFRNRYREVRLETISQALLGEGKLKLPDQINKIPANLLAQYNLQDARLTMRLTQFDNDLAMGLILLLMRVSHQGMHDLTRTAVSNWIRSLLYYAHRQQNYLIPRQDEIATFKGEAVTEAIIKGKKYMGAIVVEPKEGVHFNVTVLDFASLYPSIMKAYNLSYETVRCDHPECKDNLVPGTPHWVCTRREGITSQIIGLIRDVRVEHFKPQAKNKTLSPDRRNWFSVVEQALKVFSNAAYGVLGASHFPLYCAPAAECYSDDTEVLTENGWKLFKDLDPNEKVATLGKTGVLEYELPLKYIAEPYSGPMFSQVSSNIDLLVTPNHNMYVGWRGRSKYKQVIRWGFRTPTEMPRYVKYKRNAEWTGEEQKWFILPPVKKKKLIGTEIPKRDRKGRLVKSKPQFEEVAQNQIRIPMDDWLRFFGIWLAEGCATGGNSRDYKVIVTQSNLEKRAKIKNWLDKLPFDFKEYEKNLTIHNKQLYSYLEQFHQSYDKFIPRDLLELSPRQLGILFKSMMLGDGWRGRSYGTASKALADNVQELVLKMGCASTITNSGGFNTIYVSYQMLEPMQNKGVDHRSWVDYNGMVYCVNVKNHLIYVRRNGKACWSGNSVTALGRYAITQTIEKAEEIGVTVLYGDTDSLFLDRPTREQLKQLIDFSEKELRVELDVEKVYRYVALSSRKKNYLGVSKDGQVDIKGLTGKKRNTPLFLQVAFMEMIDILRQVRDPDGFTSAKERILRLAREKLTMLERREFNVEDLAIRVQLTKNLEAYTKTTPQHVKAAKQLRDAGKEVTAGDIIAFVKTTGGVKPVAQATTQDIDVSKYKDLVKSTFEQVLDALGVEWLDTIGMRRLDTFFG